MTWSRHHFWPPGFWLTSFIEPLKGYRDGASQVFYELGGWLVEIHLFAVAQDQKRLKQAQKRYNDIYSMMENAKFQSTTLFLMNTINEISLSSDIDERDYNTILLAVEKIRVLVRTGTILL